MKQSGSAEISGLLFHAVSCLLFTPFCMERHRAPVRIVSKERSKGPLVSQPVTDLFDRVGSPVSSALSGAPQRLVICLAHPDEPISLQRSCAHVLTGRI